MAWNDTKQAQDDFTSAEYNDMVTDQESRGKINTPENVLGSACSGIDGSVNRVLTLNNTSLTKAGGLFVFVSGRFQSDTMITVTHNSAGSTVLFIDKLWDVDEISVVYLT